MQRKTIQKIIKKKMEDWLLSITDEVLRSKVKDNILVSGGSITSLFLNEDVNDFDVYIQDMDVLKDLTDYYIKPYSDIILLDGRNRDELLLESELRTGIYRISLENLKERQIKLFFESRNGGISANKDATDEENMKYIPKFFSPNAISLSNKIQIVTRFNGNAEEIHKTFDFIHATNYFTFNEGLVTNVEALESILTKQLRYQGSLYPVTSIIRCKKFLKRHWNITAGEELKIMFQISELNLSNLSVLEEQLIGVDVAYFGALINILRSKIDDKDFTMTSSYINKIIDKVFSEEDDE